MFDSIKYPTDYNILDMLIFSVQRIDAMYFRSKTQSEGTGVDILFSSGYAHRWWIKYSCSNSGRQSQSKQHPNCNRNYILLVLELNELAAAMSADNHVLVQISKQQLGPAFKITNIFKGDRSEGLSNPHVAVSSTWPDLNQIIPREQWLYRRITRFAAPE